MKIALSTDLNHMKVVLSAIGYEVYDINSGVNCDIYIYSGLKNQLLNSVSVDNKAGALVINANGKEVDEILYEIKSRTYSPLF